MLPVRTHVHTCTFAVDLYTLGEGFCSCLELPLSRNPAAASLAVLGRGLGTLAGRAICDPCICSTMTVIDPFCYRWTINKSTQCGFIHTRMKLTFTYKVNSRGAVVSCTIS